MTVRSLLFLIPTLPLLACGGADEGAPGADTAEAPAETSLSVEERARAIHDRVITMDTHVDIPFTFGTEVDPGVRGDYQNDLPKMQEGGLNAAFFIVYHGQGERTPEAYAQAYEQAIQKFTGIRRMAYELYPEQIELAYTAHDVERIHGEGKLVALIGVENAYPMGEDLSRLEEFYDLGARYASLTHNGHSQFGDAAIPVERLGDEATLWGGLSPLGREAVAELNRLGIMVDISHNAKSTMMDIVGLSQAPIIASHSNAAAVWEHPRNLDDEQLRAMRDNGGVVQTTALGSFLSGDSVVTVSHFVDHIEYIKDLIGVDHVGISSDFDGGGGVEGWNDTSETFNVTLEMVRRGWSEEEIGKIWGGNLRRVMRATAQVAQELQAGGE
ncbi:MAG: dipeptidase [Gemmatimonadota bacterium]